jgi:hypothetical protein
MSMGNLAVVAGMTINNLTMTWTPGQGLTGSGALSLGGTTLNLSGTYTDASNWTFNANGTISLFGSAPVTANGSYSKSSGTGSGSFTMSMGTVSIVSGISVSGMTMSWDPTNGLTGSGVIGLGSLHVSISVSYSDSSNWTFTATANGSGSVTVVPGAGINATSFTGTISDAAGTINWQMSVTLSNITLVSNLATLVNPTFTISNACPEGLPDSQCPTGNTSYLWASGTLEMNLGVGLGTQDVGLTGVYGLQSGGFELTATFSDISVVSGLLTIKSPTISLSYNEGKTVSTGTIGGLGNGTVNGYTISISGTVALNLPGFSQSLPVLLTYALGGGGGSSGYNFNLTCDFPSIGTLGSTGAATSDFAYTSSASSISLNGLSVNIPANTLVLGGQFVLPGWMASYLGGSLPNVALYATYTNAESYSVSGVFPTNLPIPTGSPDFSFSVTSFSVSLSMGLLGYTQKLDASGTFTISGSAGNAVINVVIGLSYQDATEEITGSITATAVEGYLWNNAFGLPGINLQAFAIQVGIELATSPIPLPSLGLAANLVITGPLASNLGIVSGTSIFALLNLSATSPCMDVQIGRPGGPTAINIGGGLITASYADLVLAPDGCTVGTYVVQPGFALDFQGAFFGVPLSVSALISIDPTYAPAIDFTGTMSVGAFNIQNFINFSGATVTISFTPVSFSCAFSGTATILGVTVMMAGSAAENSDAGTSSMSLTASISSFSVYGFTLQNVSFSAQYDESPGHVDFTLSATGSMSVLGNSLSVNQMTFTFSNGIVNTIYVDVSANIGVSGVLGISGDFTLSASTSSRTFLLTATGQVTMGGFSMVIAACPNNQPGLTISNSGFNLCAATFTEGFFTATISGSMYWSAPSPGTTINNASGQVVQAQANDFNFSATNVGMSICGFGVFGAVNIGDVGGVFFASASAGIGLSNTSSDQLVHIAGSFDSQGNFSFTGTGGVTLAAINFSLAVTAAVQGSNMAVTATTNLMIAGSGYTLSGSFATVPGGVKTIMAITDDLNIAGFDLGKASITLLVQPGTESVTVTDSMALGGIFNAYLNGTIGAINGQAVFNFSLTSGINIPGVAIAGSLNLSNCSDSNCTSLIPFHASVSGQFLDFYGFSYSFGSVNVNPDWSFTLQSSGSTNSCSDWTSFGVVRFQACFAGTYSIYLSTSAPNVAFQVGFNVGINRMVWVVKVSCSGHWYNPRSWHCSVSAGWGPSRSLVSISGSVDSNGNVRASFDGIAWRFKI